MEVEREIVDIYRVFFMIDRMGERYEGTISAFVGSGAFVTLDAPFVDVLVKIEDFGGDFVIEDDGLQATAKRSGEAIRLGDRIVVEIADCAILRRTVYARLVRGGAEGERPRRDGFRRGGRSDVRGKSGREGRPSDARGPGKKKSGKASPFGGGSGGKPAKKSKGGGTTRAKSGGGKKKRR